MEHEKSPGRLWAWPAKSRRQTSEVATRRLRSPESRLNIRMAVPHPQQGAFPLFKFKGIQVSVHWSWLLVAVWQVDRGRASSEYPSVIWLVYEYLALFGIVLLHEFGHAFATRQVGGHAENILLWPFGGIAYVNAPPRPGAHLWSIAAGPLVNVALFPILWGLYYWSGTSQNSLAVYLFLQHVFYVNTVLLVFNILPIYPLDGGQILQALLWFKAGYPKALLWASGVGLAGGAVLLAFFLYSYLPEIPWMPGLICLFLLSNSWQAFQKARLFLKGGMPDRG